MVLSDEDKTRVRNLWSTVSKNPETYGAEALCRMFSAHPTTKTYFPHFDHSPGSSDLKAQGRKVTSSRQQPGQHRGCPFQAQRPASPETARGSVNLKMLGECIKTTVAAHNGPFNPEVLLSFDKFPSKVAKVLASKYR